MPGCKTCTPPSNLVFPLPTTRRASSIALSCIRLLSPSSSSRTPPDETQHCSSACQEGQERKNRQRPWEVVRLLFSYALGPACQCVNCRYPQQHNGTIARPSNNSCTTTPISVHKKLVHNGLLGRQSRIDAARCPPRDCILDRPRLLPAFLQLCSLRFGQPATCKSSSKPAAIHTFSRTRLAVDRPESGRLSPPPSRLHRHKPTRLLRLTMNGC
ncbi:hypothetical protein BDW22DRAFT_65700 [Trametopsis cervina]|nr:hypothetical protein BDW22DRAFT_65700 [Trametopsis cervina]